MKSQGSCPLVLILLVSAWRSSGGADANELMAFRKVIEKDPSNCMATWTLRSAKPPCDWQGVECERREKAGGERVVRALELSGKNLKGTLWKEMGNLRFLVRLKLPNNRLSGRLLEEMGGMYMLEEIDLTNNRLAGQVPSSLGHIKTLTTLLLGGNSIVGDFPATACAAPNLRILDLGSNNLTGRITSHISNCQNLEVLKLNNNLLRGAIPDKPLAILTNLRTLDLSGNRISGSLPYAFTTLQYLTYLNLRNNLISGQLPAQISNVYFIQTLDLSGNLLAKEIPVTFGNLSSLEFLDLSRNKLFGTIPHQMGQLITFSGTLNLSHNRLSGFIPASLGNMDYIKVIDLSYNMLQGSFPNTLGGCTMLVFLDVSSNQLDGSLRNQFDNFTRLIHLNFSRNFFSGGLPDGLGKLTSLEVIDFSHNQLTDPLPDSLDQLDHLMFLDVSNNKITGPMPPYRKLNSSIFLGVSGNNMSGILPDTDLIRRLQARGFFNDYMQLCGPLLQKVCTSKSDNGTASRSTTTPIFMAMAATIILLIIIITLYLFYLRMYNSRSYYECIDCLDLLCSFLLTPVRQPWQISSNVIQQLICDDNLVRVGGHCKVYRANLADGRIVAIKVVHKEAYLETRLKFVENCKTWASLKHPNVLKVFDWRCRHRFLAVIVEYMNNGPVEDYISKKKNMGWEHRKKVAVTMAFGLEFLHQEQVENRFVHCFVFPRKVLLNEDYVAHLSGFQFITDLTNHHDSFTMPSGFSGYLAPECSTRSTFTIEAEVYSYGVVLLELLTNKRASGQRHILGFSLPATIRKLFPDRIKPFVNSAILRTTNKYHQVISLIRIALCCTEDDPSNRPTMNEVVSMLDKDNLIRGSDSEMSE